MRGALVIAGKDLRNMFLSPLFYVLAGICTAVWAFLYAFAVRSFIFQSRFSQFQPGQDQEGLSLHFTVIVRHISLVNLVMIFAVSALTMRLFTEEKRNRTFDLLLTAPVSATGITLGKLLAGLGTAWALVGLSLLYPLSLAIFSGLEWGPLISSYLGLSLLVGVYVSIGMFASSLTQSAVLAVIMASIFNIMVWFIGAAADASNDPAQKAVLEHLNVSTHFFNFIKGNVSIAGFVFFTSLIFMFSFLTQRVVESSRWR